MAEGAFDKVNPGERVRVTVAHTFEGVYRGIQQIGDEKRAVFDTDQAAGKPRGASGRRLVPPTSVAQIERLTSSGGHGS